MRLVVAAAVAATSTVHAAGFDPALQWQQLKSPHFMLYYDAALTPLAQRTARYAEEAYDVLTTKYRWKPLGRTAVVLTDTNDVANGLATVLPYNYLLLRVSAPRPDAPLAHYDNWLKMLVTHELTHIIHMDQARGVMKLPRFFLGKVVSPNGMLPGWMREGLAVHEESAQTGAGRNRGAYADMMLRTALLQQNFPKLDQADGLGWRWPGYLTQYLHGGKFVEWLARTYGEDAVARYQQKVAASPFFFMNNALAKRVWKKSFYKLWKEWQGELQLQFAPQIAAIKALGESTIETPFTDDGVTFSGLALSRDGRTLAYTSANPHRAIEVRLRDLVTNEERVIRRKQGATSADFDAAGQRLAFSAYGAYKRYRYISDIYLYDLGQQKLWRLTAGRRASDPSFSPDGKQLIYVVEFQGQQRLARYDIATRKETLLPLANDPAARFSQPRWSPDGRSIVVSSWQGGQHDLYLYAPDGTPQRRLTNDRAIDSAPRWDADGRTIYYASDRSGVPNIYRLSPRGGRPERVTNVLTGVFEPVPTPDGEALYAQYYTGKGFGVRRLPIDYVYVDDTDTPERPVTAARTPAQRAVQQSAGAATPPPEFPAKKYNAFGPKLFIPRYFVPGIAATGSGLLLSGATGSSDPLRRHIWQAGATYRTDAGHVGYFGSYAYNRFTPVFNLGVANYAVDFGNLTFLHSDGTLRTVHLYEKRLRGSVGVSFPLKSTHSVGLQYFMEDRDNIPALTDEERVLLNLDRFAGFSATYAWGRLEQFPASISPEQGHRLLMNFTITDKIFGGDERNEQQIFSGELREFVKLPWQHHVLGLRVKGGMTWGDRLVQGTFGMGGALGEGTLGGGGGFYYFPLRGLPVSALSRTRALLFSGEYRIPIASPQRGLGTTPFYLQNIHAALFADYGNAWNAGESTGTNQFGNFFLGTGAELRGDFVLGHGLPVQGRIGYGIVVLNRDRLGALTDPLFGTAIKNGTFILQLGTAF